MGYENIAIFNQYLALSRKRYKIWSYNGNEQELVCDCDLSNGAIFNDLE